VAFPGGKGSQCVRLTTLPLFCAVVTKSGNLNFLEHSGLLQACNGTALPSSDWLYLISAVMYIYIYIYIYIYTHTHLELCTRQRQLAYSTQYWNRLWCVDEKCVCEGKRVKWTRYRPGVAQTVGRGIAVLFHVRGTRRAWVVSSTARPHFTSGKDVREGEVKLVSRKEWALTTVTGIMAEHYVTFGHFSFGVNELVSLCPQLLYSRILF